MPRRFLLLAALAALVAAAFPQFALAQFYKGKTITMIINYPAGGPADIEGRIVAQHLPNHIPGKPTVVIKNVSGAGGIIGSNQLGEAAPNGETIGFFTLDVIAQLVANPSLRTNYSEFVMIAGFENPLVAYARKDTPPGLQVATDIMKAGDFKALSLNLQNSNTVNQSLSLDLLGSVEPTMADLVMPLWQIAARGKDGGTPRSRAMPDLPTFEEFFESVHHKKPSGFLYEVLRTSSDPLVAMFRTALLPPRSPAEITSVMRSAFVALAQDKDFIRDYSNAVKADPLVVPGVDAQEIVTALGTVKPEIKAFVIDYTSKLVK
jgi:hypothetical protein